MTECIRVSGCNQGFLAYPRPRRDLCIKMHEEVSKKLLPLFKDLADMDMLVLFTKADGVTVADVSN